MNDNNNYDNDELIDTCKKLKIQNINSKLYLSALVLIVFVVVIFSLWSNKAIKDKTKPYKVFRPKIQDAKVIREYTSEIQAIQQIKIRSRLNGIVESLEVDEGALVNADQVILTLRDDEYLQEVAKAKATLKSAKAEQQLLELELANINRLVANNIASKTEADMLTAKVEISKGKVQEQEAFLANAMLNLSRTQIKAPFSGNVGALPLKSGSFVDEGTLLTSLVNSKEIFAYFAISEKEYHELVTSDPDILKRPVELEMSNGDMFDQKAKLKLISNGVDRETGTMKLRAQFPNPKALLQDGSLGKIVLSITMPAVLLIPQSATFEVQDKLFVFVVNPNGIAKAREIISRISIGSDFIVSSGIQANEQVLLEGIQFVTDGAKIKFKLVE